MARSSASPSGRNIVMDYIHTTQTRMEYSCCTINYLRIHTCVCARRCAKHGGGLWARGVCVKCSAIAVVFLPPPCLRPSSLYSSLRTSSTVATVPTQAVAATSHQDTHSFSGPLSAHHRGRSRSWRVRILHTDGRDALAQCYCLSSRPLLRWSSPVNTATTKTT